MVGTFVVQFESRRGDPDGPRDRATEQFDPNALVGDGKLDGISTITAKVTSFK